MRKFLLVTALIGGLSMPAYAQNMSVQDFVLDARSLVGETVSVHGLIACLGGTDLCYLYDENNPMTFIMFDTSRLPRNARKIVLQSDMSSHVVSGQVGSGFLGTSIIAHGID
jgi:hypothetical protein